MPLKPKKTNSDWQKQKLNCDQTKRLWESSKTLNHCSYLQLFLGMWMAFGMKCKFNSFPEQKMVQYEIHKKHYQAVW